MNTRILLGILFAAFLGHSTASAELIAGSWTWRQFAWRTEGSGTFENITSYEGDVTTNSVPLGDTRYGITLSSTAFTESGFSITASASNPTAGKQWAQYIYTEFAVDVPTVLTISGTLFSPNPVGGFGMGGQYVSVYNSATAEYIYDLSGNGAYDVIGPQPYYFSTTLVPNVWYSVDSISSWTTPTDGFEGTFMTLSLSEPAPAVPEPGTWAAAALLAGGAAFARWRRRARSRCGAPLAGSGLVK